MKLKQLFLLMVVVALLSSCATVPKPRIAKVREEAPQVSPTLEQSMEHSLKRRVAIARFTNETKYGQGFFYDENDDRLGKQAMDILSTKLSSTEKFILLERVDLTFLNKEKEIGRLDSLKISADYLILGSITEFGRKATSDVGVFSRTKKQTANAKVSIRLVDVETGEIVYSEEGEGEASSEVGTVLGVGSTADYDASLNDKVLSAAISKLVSNVIEHLMDKPWRSYLLSYENGNYIIAGGAMQGIKVGDTFTVYKRGESVINPQTKVAIELPGKTVGKIQVTSVIPGNVNTEISFCTKVEGEIPTKEFSDYYIQEQIP